MSVSVLVAAVLVRSGLALAAEGKKWDENSPEVRRLVLATLRPPTAEEIDECKRVLSEVIGEDATKRGRATKEFMDKFAWRLHPLAVHLQPWMRSLDKQQAARLHQLLGPQTKSGQAIRRSAEFAERIKNEALADRPAYLIGLLDQAKGIDRQTVIGRLEEITRQKLGQDVSAWKDWLAKHGDWGRFEQLAAEIGGLIRLKLEGGAVKLDRDHWEAVAAATDKEKLRQQWKERMVKGGFGERAITHRLERLDKMSAAELVHTRLLIASGTGSTGRRSSGNHLLRLHFSAPGIRSVFCREGATVHILLAETTRSNRQLEVFDNGKGVVWVMLTDMPRRSVVLAHQQADGEFSLARTTPTGQAHCQERSFAAARAKYRQFVDQELLGALRGLGVSLSPMGKAVAISTEPIARPMTPRPVTSPGKPGPLAEIKDDTGQLIALTVDAKGLRLNRAHWQWVLKDVDLAELRKENSSLGIQRLREDSWRHLQMQIQEWKQLLFAWRAFRLACAKKFWGGGGGSGSGGGGGRWQSGFSIANAMRGDLRLRDDAIEIELKERTGPVRHVRVSDNGSGDVHIRVLALADGALLDIRQLANGRFIVAEAGESGFFLTETESFKAFGKKYAQYLDQHLLGSLQGLGVVAPPSPYGQAVTDGVLLRLTGPSERDLQEGRRLIAQLDADEFEKREEAARLLVARAARYDKALSETKASHAGSPEVKIRLAKVFKEMLRAGAVDEVIDGMGLLTDADYLVALLAKARGEDRDVVAAQLKKITGQDLGADPHTWRQWLMRNGKSVKRDGAKRRAKPGCSSE